MAGSSAFAFPKGKKPSDPKWARSATGRFYRFVDLDPEELGLSGKSGVFVIWHGGVQPEWVFVDRSRDLAATFHAIAEDEEVMYYDLRGRLFVTWTLIKPEFQEGVVRYLIESLKPIIDNPNAEAMSAEPIPVFPPAYHP